MGVGVRTFLPLTATEIGIPFRYSNHNWFVIAVSVAGTGRARTTSTGTSTTPTVLPPATRHPSVHFYGFAPLAGIFVTNERRRRRRARYRYRGRLLDEDFLRGSTTSSTGNGRRGGFVASGDATHYDGLLAL